MVLMRIKKNYHQILPFIKSSAEYKRGKTFFVQVLLTCTLYAIAVAECAMDFAIKSMMACSCRFLSFHCALILK